MPKRWEAEFPERDASVLRRKASQQGVPTRNRPFRESKGARDGALEAPSSGGCPSQGPGDPRGADRRLLSSAMRGRLQRARSPKS